MAKMAPAKSSQVGMVVVFVAIIFLMMSIQLASAASESDDTLPVFKFGKKAASSDVLWGTTAAMEQSPQMMRSRK
ncbi:hypothetical protein Patl1_11927 [Pistacia atlantica]|uniref:Uncharacterized protein n=1 Tax=Pistacia atlantica TaxID=434234 RepID=A0ACC1A1Z7_9ROSI|nr:hypothetical protein Patl1_11927 [Pistacia atlantica]